MIQINEVSGGEEASKECPNCHSRRNWKDGLRETNFGTVQRFLCRDCRTRFSERSNNDLRLSRNRQLCALLEAKKLDTATETKTVAGEKNSSSQEAEIKAVPQIEILLKRLENDGRKPTTIKNYRKALRHLVKQGANLLDPENTKEALSKSTISPRTKKCSYVPVLNYWFDFIGIQWKPPKYSCENEIPYMPSETEIDTLIAGCGKKIATYLQLIKDTGARCGEISRLKWTSIDFQQKVVRISAEKGSNSRILPVSPKSIDMLNNLTKNGERIFTSAEHMRANFFVQRRRIAKKLGNPRLLEIHFHTLRHWKATTEQHKTKDPWHVKEILGHKSIQSTEVYIHIEKQLYQNGANDEFIVKVANTPKEITALMETGFEYIMTKDDLSYFRKRK
jgi:integrase